MRRPLIHTLAAACALLAAAPARADDIAHVPLGDTIHNLLAGPDGGAWIGIERPRHRAAVGRVRPDGGYLETAVSQSLDGATLGPDGQAWFSVALTRLLRADGADATTLSRPLLPSPGHIGDALATGPDGNLWSVTSSGLMSIPPAGRPTPVPLDTATCVPGTDSVLMRAADGALWISDERCHGVIRFAPDGTQSFLSLRDDGALGLAPDATGGMWFVSSNEQFGGHVDASGAVTHVDAPGETDDVAVAPDGSAWFALGSCQLARVGPGGVQYLPTPIPATRLAFDPVGALWLASESRLVHTSVDALAGPCDDHKPSLLHGARSISLAALRHHRWPGVTVREPVYFTEYSEVDIGHADQYGDESGRALGAGTRRVPLPPGQLQRIERGLAAGRPVSITLWVSATDRDGNRNVGIFATKVTR